MGTVSSNHAIAYLEYLKQVQYIIYCLKDNTQHFFLGNEADIRGYAENVSKGEYIGTKC